MRIVHLIYHGKHYDALIPTEYGDDANWVIGRVKMSTETEGASSSNTPCHTANLGMFLTLICTI